MMNHRKTALLAAAAAVLVTVPYVYAALAGGTDAVFGGFLLNPVDGNTYLAKMYQGWSGSWRFVLPYTAEPGQGAYLFIYYLFLGHLARLVGLPLIWTFHIARTVGSVLLVFALARFYRTVFPEQPRAAWLALLVSVLGSGFGWLASLLGGFTADLWVAEAYPFLSMYANPHFPLGTALLVWMLTLLLGEMNGERLALLAVLGLLLSAVMPFELVIAAAACAVKYIWDWLAERKLIILPYIAAFLPGGLYLLYQWWVSTHDPVLAGWNAQNLTPAPVLWDTLVAFSPALPLVILGARLAWKERSRPAVRLLVGWAVIGLLLAYAPFNLQRRFLAAYYVPLAGLAVFGVQALQKFKPGGTARMLLYATMLTNLIVILAGLSAVQTSDPALYLRNDDVAAMQWIRENTDPHALVLASPDTSLYIPAWTGRRVIYGHPFETVDAAEQKQQVADFLLDDMPSGQAEQWLAERHVDYILWGAHDQRHILPPLVVERTALYQHDSFFIYSGAK